MIPNLWYAALDASEVKKGKPVGAERMGEKLVFWREQSGNVVCMRDLCAHRGAALSIGRLIHNRIECPFHGLEYDAQGKCVCIPANGMKADVPENFKVFAYPCKEAYGMIWIFWGEQKENLPEIPFFDDLKSGFFRTCVADPWKSHYSRSIENQLDVVHLPFVHRTTIGRGCKTLVNGPYTEADITGVKVWSDNVVDTGQKPKKASELSRPADFKPTVHFKFPNIWQLSVSDNFRIAAAFAPINDENTMVYLQTFVKNKFFKVFSPFIRKSPLIIAHQDRPVVETQRPSRSHLKMKENLVPGDMPIIEYRKYRQMLIDAAKPIAKDGQLEEEEK